MDNGSYDHTFYRHPIERVLLSGGPASQSQTDADVVPSRPALDLQSSLHYPLLFEELMNPSVPAIPPDVDNLHVNVNACYPASLSTSMQPPPFHGFGILDLEALFTGTQDVAFSSPDPSGPMGQAGLLFTTQGQGGFEHARSATRIQNGDSTSNRCQSGNVPQDQSHRYIHADKIPNDSVSSPAPQDSRTLATAERQQEALDDQPQKVQKKRKVIPATSSLSARGPAVIHKAQRLQFLCKICGRPFAQRQGVTRHQREAHTELGFGTNRRCGYCGEPWARPYLFREHLEKVHPDVDPDAELEKVKDSENSRNYVPQERVPPILEDDRGVDYDLQSKFAKVTIMESERDDARQSEALNHTPIRHTNSQDGCTAVDPSSNLVTASALVPACPVSEDHGNPLPVTHAVDPPLSTYSSLAHALDETPTNGLLSLPLEGDHTPTYTSPDTDDASPVLDIRATTEANAEGFAAPGRSF